MKNIGPIYNTKYFWVIASLFLLFIIWYFMSGKTPNVHSKGPSYDLIFGVYVFDPDLKSIYNISPYVYEGKLHLQIDREPDIESTAGTSIALYRYNSKLGMVEQLPLPTSAELDKITDQQRFVFTPTKNFKLNTNNQSPDGFTLAEPNWVKADLISNILGNIPIFFSSGSFQSILKRETFPRLKKGAVSIPLKGGNNILNNEADNAFLLGWVTP